MPSTSEPGETGRALIPAAWLLFSSLLALVLAIACMVGATPGTEVFANATPPPAWLYGLTAATAMTALYAAAMVADRMWRASARDAAPDLAGSPIADPIAGLTAPYRHGDDKAEAALRLEQVAHIFRQLDVMMAINVINAILVALAIWSEANGWLLTGWLALVAIGAAGVVRSRRKSRSRPAPAKVSKRTLRRISVHSGWRGLAWGAAFALFFADAGVAGKLILGSVSVGMLAGGVLALAPIPSAALLYGLGVMVPTILRLVSFGSGDLVILAMFGITYSGSMMIVAYQLYYNFATNHAAERAQAEQAATISMLLNEFETSASDWLWETDDAGRLTRLPERMAGLVGIGPGSPDNRPMLDAVLRACDGDTGAAVRDAMAAGVPFRDQIVRVTDSYGEPHWISLSGSPKPDGGYRGVGSDTTAKAVAQEERQRALERAEKAEQRLRDGIASVGSGFLLAGSDGRITIANQGFYEIFPAAKLLGDKPALGGVIEAQARLWQATATADNRGWAAAMGAPVTGNGAPVDIELPTNRWIRLKRAPTTEGGTVMLLTDVTDIKRQEATLALQARQLAASNTELEQFAAVASHDLQEPLRKIEAFGARLGQKMDGKLDEESSFFLERMMSATGRMRVLITDLLSYSRVGRKGGRHREIDLDRLLADVLDDLALTVAERKAVVRASRLGTMLGEPTQMRQLVQNLLSNAFKFAKKNAPPLVEIECRPAVGGGFVLVFKDHGIGFDMKHHDRIFEIFHRLHGREQYEGTGIGLATCRKIVERHGGSLRAESAPGEGATFFAAFPRAVVEPSAADPGTLATSTA